MISKSPAPIPCFVCIEPLENVVDDVENQPYKGTMFTSPGHYGSTIFDPMDGSYLLINICDKCLEQRNEQALLCHNHTKTQTDYRDWNPTESEEEE